MRILKLSAKGRLEVKNIKNELRVLQNEVGGYIEPVTIFDDKDIVILADEEGKLKRRSANPFIPGLVGDVIICGVKGEEFCSLSISKTYKLARLFGGKQTGNKMLDLSTDISSH